MKSIDCLIFSSLLLVALPCSAKNFTIPNGDNIGFLKAVTEANESSEADTITLAKRGLYAISTPASRTSLLPAFRNTLTIEGNGAEIRRYTKAALALVSVDKGSQIVFRDLILAEGSEGAVINRGNLLLDRVRIIDTDAGKSRAIITNYGRMSLNNSELAHNHVPVRAHDTGVIINHGELSISFSKIHDNTVRQDRNKLVVALGALNFGQIKINELVIDANDIDPDINAKQLSGIINIGKAKVFGRFPQKQIIQKPSSSWDIVAHN